MLIAIFAVLILFIALLVTLLLSWSPGRTQPLLDQNSRQIPGSISEKIFVNINGLDQGMFIQSVNPDNPVLLFIHGGLGMPEFFLNAKHPAGLEQSFTVCWWERRGAGLSYSSGMSPQDVTVEQWISDTIAVTDYLLERFGRKKIVLAGHSGGSFIGIQTAARAPEKYLAYVGISQMAHQIESEKLTYRLMLEQYAKAGNEKMVKKLKQYPILNSDPAVLLAYFPSLARDQAMHDLGIGTMHTMKSVISGVFLPTWQCRNYTLREKINIWRGKAFLQRSTNIPGQMIMTDLRKKVSKLELPVYFISGIHDYTVCYALSKEYLKGMEAPVKGFYTFHSSAHSPLFEEPERFRQILAEDVLNGKNDLADQDSARGMTTHMIT